MSFLIFLSLVTLMGEPWYLDTKNHLEIDQGRNIGTTLSKGREDFHLSNPHFPSRLLQEDWASAAQTAAREPRRCGVATTMENQSATPAGYTSSCTASIDLSPCERMAFRHASASPRSQWVAKERTVGPPRLTVSCCYWRRCYSD